MRFDSTNRGYKFKTANASGKENNMSINGFESVADNWGSYIDDFDYFTRLAEEGVEFYEPNEHIVYIADMGGDNGTELYGYMAADLVAEANEAEASDIDVVEWALESIPAPGTGASNRMEQISLEGMFSDLQMYASTMLFRKFEM